MGVRKRVKGRFVSEDEANVVRREQEAIGALRPKQCRKYAQRRIAEAFPEIVERFLLEAKQGSVPHAKALAALSGLDRVESPPVNVQTKNRGVRRNSLTEMLLQELKRGRDIEGEQRVCGENAGE